MSERPANSTQPPQEPQNPGGWRKPAVPGIWQPKRKPTNGNVSVPILPKELNLKPKKSGGWHLPQPEHTIYSPQDTTLLKPERVEAIQSRPEDIILTLASEESSKTEPAPEAPAPEEVLETESQQTTPETEAALKSDLAELEAGTKADSESDNLLALEGLSSLTGADLDDEDDDSAFSMSELMALSSLVEKAPQANIVPSSSVTTEPTATTSGGTGTQAPAESEQLSQTGAEDPADYARKQLEQLGLGGTGAQSPASSTATSTQTTDDPAAYARRQLEQLENPTGTATPVLPATPITPAPAANLTPQQQQLATRFRQTEDQVRALRQSYQLGQISRDELQDQLKKLMILDDQNVWWMMGVETDTWYRFQDNNWVVAVPPVLAAQGQAPARTGTPPTLTSNVDPVSVIGGGSLPYFPSEPVAPVSGQTQVTGGFGITEELGLPKQGIPIQDPEATLVGPIGTTLPPVRPSEAETLMGMGRVSEPTVINPRVDDPYAGAAIEAPIQEQYVTAPDYAMDQAAAPTFEQIAEQQRQRTVRTIITIAVVAVGGLILLVACGLLFALSQYNGIAGQFTAQVDGLANYSPEFQTARILDMNGNLITELNSQDGGSRTSVPLSKISPFMVHAVVSLENERFYEDPGWDWVAIGRAFIQNVSAGQVESGASTITQQIAEQLILRQPTTTPELKLQEIIIAAEIAKKYDKNKIMELYLNEVYFGNQAYGVEAAAQFYFHHSANDLNLPEAALLAGMISSPVQYNPVRAGNEDAASYGQRRDLAFQRMEQVITRMQEVGCVQFQHAPYLTQPFCVDAAVVRQATVQKAQVKAAEYAPRDVEFKYPHFVQFVQALVENQFGSGEMFRRGFVIKTTLNPSVQDVAQGALQQTMQNLIVTNVNTGSVMVTDPRTGAIRAMVGSPNFNDENIKGQVNGALTFQQPGSSIKPVLYTAALEGVQGVDGRLNYYTPATVLWDVPTTFVNPNYTPVNFDGLFHGPVPLRYALQNSFNIPAVKTYQFIGNEKFRDVATRMGLTFPDGAVLGLPSALGATDVTLYGMMSAYGTLANAGTRAPLYAIDSITDASGVNVPLTQRPAPTQVIQPQVAYLMDNILSDDVARAAAFGQNGNLTIRGLPTSNVVAAKTGTTNDARDLWTMGFTTNAVVGVWLGRPDNEKTFVTDGGYGSAAPLWNRVMQSILQTMPAPSSFPIPQGVVQQQICADTGTLPAAGCSSLRSELFVQTQPPPGPEQSLVQRVAVDSWTGLRANEFCPSNQITLTVMNIQDQSAVQWLTSAAGAAVAQRLGLADVSNASIPSAACDTNTDVPLASFISPGEGQTISGVVPITGAATASATNFSRYQIEVASAAAPTAFTIISGPTTVPQTSGLLGQWTTTSVPNGPYIVRLAMFANNGGYVYKTVNVNVANVAPTQAPVVPTAAIDNGGGLFPSTAIPFDAVTPIPFDVVVTPNQ